MNESPPPATSSTSTLGQALFRDTRVSEATEALLNVVEEYAGRITGVRPADPDLKEDYAAAIEAFSELRGGKLFFPYLGSGLGRGPLVELGDGSVKYDFISGIGVHHFGHSHPELIRASIGAALGDTVMQGNLQQNAESHAYTRLLVDAANRKGAGLDHCFLTSTGVMGGENAIKIAFQKKHPADRILAFSRCFAGRTLALSQVTDKPAFRVGLPTVMGVDYVPFFDAARPEASTEAAVQALSAHLARHPGKYAAMVFELVQGEGGFYTAPASFHRRLMEILKEHDVAILVDEVQTFARTPELFAFQHLELDDLVDVVWIGKASQVCATLFRREFAPKPGLLSQTFTASSAALAAGKVVLEQMLGGGYFGPGGRIEQIERAFHERLGALSAAHPDRLAGPFGIGGMVGCTPFGGEAKAVTMFVRALYDNGVMGFMAGSNPMRARFLIPVAAVRDADIADAMDIFEDTLLSLSV